MKSHISSLHDKFFKEVMSDQGASVAFMKEFLPIEVSNYLDFKSLRQEEGSYIDTELEETFSDLVYSVETKGGSKVNIHILLEHKSYPDPNTCFQVLGYLASAYQKQSKSKNGFRPIIPLVFYQGKKKWKYKEIEDFFGDFPQLLNQFIPKHSSRFVSLKQLTNEEVYQISDRFLASAIVLQKNYFEPDALINSLVRILESFMPYLDKSQQRSIFIYLFQNQKINKNVLKETLKLVANTKTIDVMSLYDELISQGVQKGLSQGLEKGLSQGFEKGLETGREEAQEEALKKTVLNAYKNQIDVPMIKLITGENEDKIKEILKKNGIAVS